MSRKLRTGLVVGIGVGLLAVAAVRFRPPPSQSAADLRGAGLGVAGYLERFELAFLDALTVRESRRIESSGELVMVAIDDESLARAREALGAWPWPREVMGKIVEELRTLGAKLVVVDLIYVDPDVRPGGDDYRFAELLDEAGGVVLGFSFADVSDERQPSPGRWASLRGSYPTRGAALIAAAPLLAWSTSPYLVNTEERVELWLGGYRDRAATLEDLGRLSERLGWSGKEQPVVRELAAEETLERVTRELLFAERNSVPVRGAQAITLRTTPRTLQSPIAPLVASSAGFGNVQVNPSEDGVVRSVQHLTKYEGRFYPSLALAAALRLTGATEVVLEDGRLKLGRHSVPVDKDGSTMLRFYGRRGPGGERLEAPYPSVPIFSVIKSVARREAGRSIDRQLIEKVKDKVVFISNEAMALGDHKPIPTSRDAVGTTVAATALDNLLRNHGLVRASIEYDSLVAFVMAMLGATLSILLTRSSRMKQTAVVEIGLALVTAAGFLSWVSSSYRDGLWVGAVIPMSGFLLALMVSTAIDYADEHKSSSLVREALGRYTSPVIVEQILRNPHYFSLEGEQRVMTVMFTDIKDFTTISEAMKPRELVAMLNEYLTTLTGVIDRNRGQVDKFIGDAVMAYWGAPLPNHLHAADACRAAVQIRDAIVRNRPLWKERFGVELSARVGVNTGDMVVGNMGSKGAHQKVNYTVIGDAVNLASRLESAGKAYGTDILIGEGTFEEAREMIEVREIDLVRVKGKHRPVRVFELLAMKGGLPEARRAVVTRFEQALIAYRSREFAAALEQFESLAAELPADRAVAVYVERCRACLQNPPAEGWDGVYDMAQK